MIGWYRFCDEHSEGVVLNDTQRLKRYLAEEMVEEYEEGRISRRQMIVTVGRILGVAVVSPALLASLGCANMGGTNAEESKAPVPESRTDGVTVEPNDPDIEVTEVEVPGEEGAISAYQARPAGEGPYVQRGRIGGIGWCWGGGQAWRLATKEPKMNAVSAFYGPNPPLEDVPDIQAAVLDIYGGG